MNGKSIGDTFSFLIESGRFSRGEEQEGMGFREAYFHSPEFVMRIAEQSEDVFEEGATTTLCFLIDPENTARWCMFQEAVTKLLKVRVGDLNSIDVLAESVRAHITGILEKTKAGIALPFQDPS